MKNKKKLALQLELHVYSLLEAANKESNALLETQPRGSEAFKASLTKYREIYKLIQTNQKEGITNDVLESYFFEAWLSKLQTKENCLTESPENEAELLNNEQKLEEIRKSLAALCLRANVFFTTLKSKRSKSVQSSNFLLDCKETLNSIKSYHASWHNLSNRAKANYCYNFATTLTEQSKKEIENSQKVAGLKRAYCYVVFAMEFYAIIEDSKSEKATKVFLKQIKLSLNNLGSKETKKRKALPTSVESVTKLTKFAISDEHSEITLRYKDINEENERIWKEKINTMLNQIVKGNIPLFYSRLFFTMSARLHHYTEDINGKGGFCHIFLNRLSWLTIARNLLDLSETNVYSYQMHVLNNLDRLHKAHEQSLKVISQQKRDEAYPVYSSMQLKQLDLKHFFICEIFDYYYGLEALGFNDIDEFGYLDNILTVVRELIDQEKLYLAKKRKLSQIMAVSFDDKCLNHHFYAQLLRELVKFYIEPRNEAWILPHTSLSQALIYKECARLLEYAMFFVKSADVSGEGVNELIGKIHSLKAYLIHKINQSTSFAAGYEFFKVPAEAKSMQKIMEEHLDFIYQSRKCGAATEDIFNNILKFIDIQCEKISSELRSPVSSSAAILC